MVYDSDNKTSLNENFLGLHLKYSTAFLLAEFHMNSRYEHVNSRYEHVCINSGANTTCACVCD